MDRLGDYFLHKLETCGLIDVESIEMKSTWQKNWRGRDSVSKHLDHFLVSKQLLISIDMHQSWVNAESFFDHGPIVLYGLSGQSSCHHLQVQSRLAL